MHTSRQNFETCDVPEALTCGIMFRKYGVKIAWQGKNATSWEFIGSCHDNERCYGVVLVVCIVYLCSCWINGWKVTIELTCLYLAVRVH